ncbi:MAG: hypothetical protein CTY15_00360 [Methylocystis sp.]|nr:MAG: hypothetical protein CTY15_00360 [Methylocystis sp.]
MEDDKRDIEIIPPGESSHAEREDAFATSRIWVSSGSGEIKFVKLGPFQSMLLGLGLLALVALGLFFLSGLFLIAVPVVAALGAGAWVANKLGVGPFRRLR